MRPIEHVIEAPISMRTGFSRICVTRSADTRLVPYRVGVGRVRTGDAALKRCDWTTSHAHVLGCYAARARAGSIDMVAAESLLTLLSGARRLAPSQACARPLCSPFAPAAKVRIQPVATLAIVYWTARPRPLSRHQEWKSFRWYCIWARSQLGAAVPAGAAPNPFLLAKSLKSGAMWIMRMTSCTVLARMTDPPVEVDAHLRRVHFLSSRGQPASPSRGSNSQSTA